ncbi:MAG: F0F1 ATP synthase subunit delta [Eubacteriales bacterium]|nr:F0F1 ATP synthase subunit delta [Eubacteriales bacterium]
MEGKLIAAHPVDDETLRRVEERFTRYFGQSVTLQVELDRALMAGFVVTVNHLRFDYSVRAKLSAMKKYLLTQQS